MATNLVLPIPMITIGTTKRSIAKFWAGMGVLAQHEDSFAEYVITRKQWGVLQKQLYTTEKVSLVQLKNFREIYVFPKLLTFGV